MTPRLLLFAHDPGGANALLPVAEHVVQHPAADVHLFAAGYAVRLWGEAGLRFEEVAETTQAETAGRLLDTVRPDCILTGTSEWNPMERHLWSAARTRGIVSYCLIDNWGWYDRRFALGGEVSLPEYILTIDEESRRDMAALGIPEQRIVVSGQPFFERTARFTSALSHAAFCERYHLSPLPILTFVSDTLADSFGRDADGRPALGYDEHDAFCTLLEAVARDTGERAAMQIVVKLHPKERTDNLDETLRRCGTALAVPVTVSRDLPAQDLVYHSAVVAGMFSMLLVEARLMGRPVCALQPGAHAIRRFGGIDIPVAVNGDEAAALLAAAWSGTAGKPSPLASGHAVQTIADMLLGHPATGPKQRHVDGGVEQ